tara:strand:+ start:902 stop:1096 length:195 start_codon:yes stop_codon:yes gene_type:complete
MSYQMAAKDISKGEFVRRKSDSKKTYTRGDYDRSHKVYALNDEDDISREIYVKSSAILWVDFDY